MVTTPYTKWLLALTCVFSMAGACQENKTSTPRNDSPIQSLPQENGVFKQVSGKILFQSDRDGDWEIYVMNADGSNTMQLTHNASADEYPVWSPDGQKIAFKSDRDGNGDVYVMNADGSAQQRLTTHHARDEDPAWFPDGRSLAFHSDRESNQEIYRIALDGNGEAIPVTRTIGRNILPALSPDGQQMAYTGNRYMGWNVYVRDLTTNNDERLTDGHGACRPDWSPDGQQIAYVSQKADGKGDIWLMKPDGSMKTRATFDDKHYDYYPAWSPDGRYLSYAKTPDKETGNWEIYIMTADGQHHQQVTHHPARDKFPDWAPGHISDDDVRSREFRYEAEFAPRTTGEPAADPDASGQQAIYSAQGTDEGFLIYGPYQPYSPGKYVASFRIKVKQPPEQDPILRLDVATEAGNTIVTYKELRSNDVQAYGEYQDIEVPFSLEAESILEFRVYTFSIADLWVDNISVKRTKISR